MTRQVRPPPLRDPRRGRRTAVLRGHGRHVAALGHRRRLRADVGAGRPAPGAANLGPGAAPDEAAERLREVEVLHAAVRAADSLAVVAEKVEPLVRVDDQLGAGCALGKQ